MLTLLGLPFIGSIHEISFKNNWMKFHEWGEQYGPIFQTNLGGVNHVWITRDSVAHEVLSKKAYATSDRPHLAAIEADNRTSGHYLPLMSRNGKCDPPLNISLPAKRTDRESEVWVRQRRFAKQFMDKSAQASFYGYCELEAVRMMMELLNDPKRYHESLESYSARVTSRLAWGSPHASDELKQRARELLIAVSPTGAIGNNVPILNSLPEALFPQKTWERRRARTEKQFFKTMQEDVQNEISSPLRKPRPTWMQMFLENKSFWGFESDEEGSYAVGMNSIAGALTIAAPMQSFCLALLYHQQYQPMLHEEIDRVCGDRMPTLHDMPNMPVTRYSASPHHDFWFAH